jgi:hypothetical protein
MNRDAAFKLTDADVEAVRAATLGTHGIVQADGTY